MALFWFQPTKDIDGYITGGGHFGILNIISFKCITMSTEKMFKLEFGMLLFQHWEVALSFNNFYL